MIDGQATVKRLDMRGGTILLKPENENYRSIPVTDPSSFVISSVVVGVGRRMF
jgi:SOS-response transcriptional repressor LexA